MPTYGWLDLIGLDQNFVGSDWLRLDVSVVLHVIFVSYNRVGQPHYRVSCNKSPSPFPCTAVQIQPRNRVVDHADCYGPHPGDMS